MRILKYTDHINSNRMTEELIELIINPMIKESSMDDGHIRKILKGLSSDIKFNYGLVLTFGTGIKAIYPIVENLIKNGNLKIDLTPESILLLSITALSITYLEEQNNKEGNVEVICSCKGKKSNCELCNGSGKTKSIVTKQDAQTLLEELKLRGIGNGIVKKLVTCFKSIGNIVKILFKNTPYVIRGLMEMFAYTSILIPTMHAISALVGNYKLDMETLPSNFVSLGIGIATFLAKNGYTYVLNKLKSKFNIKDSDSNTLPSFKSHDIKDGDSADMGKNTLIKEQ